MLLLLDDAVVIVELRCAAGPQLQKSRPGVPEGGGGGGGVEEERTNTQIHTHTCIHIHTHTQKQTRTYAHTHTHTHIHTYTRTHVHTQTHVHTIAQVLPRAMHSVSTAVPLPVTGTRHVSWARDFALSVAAAVWQGCDLLLHQRKIKIKKRTHEYEPGRGAACWGPGHTMGRGGPVPSVSW